MEEFSTFVGIDWGTEAHQVCVLDGARNVLREALVPHSGSGLAELVKTLLAVAQGDTERIAVGIEVPRGAIVETLVEHGMAVFAINPKQLDRFRDRHTVAGAKDDRRDAFVLADSLRTDRPAFRRAQLGDPQVIQLRELSRLHDELKAERVALGNRLQEQLRRYFPQIFQLGSVYDDRWLWELLEAAPTPELAKRINVAKLRSMLRRHHIRSISAEAAKEILGTPPLHIAPGVLEACRKHVGLLIPRLRLVREQKVQVEREIETLLEEMTTSTEGKTEHRDALLLQSLPGLGKLVCATMLAEAWEPLAARDYTTLRGLSGAAPITKRSGKQHAVFMRTACNHRLRSAVHFWAGNAVQRDPHWRARYAAMRAAGHGHSRALRGIGDRLLRMLVAMLKTGTPYDPARRRAVHQLAPQPLEPAAG